MAAADAIIADAFVAERRAEGFQEFLERDLPPGAGLEEHSHPFDAQGLVLEGRFTVASAAGLQDCGPGQAFALGSGVPHTEAAGPDGARLLIARRHPAAG